MLNLLLALCSSSLVSIIMRMSTERVQAKVSMLALNYLMCLGLSLLHTGGAELFPAVEGLGRTLALGVVNGALYLGSFILLQVNTRQNGVVLSSVFMKLGLLVPIALSVLFFGEMPRLMQIIGFVLAVFAIILINMGSGEKSAGFKAGLILLLLGGGMTDAMSKVFEQYGSAELSAQFLLYTFAVALVLCVLLMLARKERPGKAELFYGLLIGVPNFYSARFLLHALESVPAVIAYPTYSVGSILVVTLAGTLFFGETLSARRKTALCVILVALVLLNI